ncbi:unnamed protein product [Amoebophrya sp. A25]|nr:unnamed protein product [Amoebophrya sp. A25]|eukprot:GSA25T00010597001.1
MPGMPPGGGGGMPPGSSAAGFPPGGGGGLINAFQNFHAAAGSSSSSGGPSNVRVISSGLLPCRCGSRLDLLAQEEMSFPAGTFSDKIQIAEGAEGGGRANKKGGKGGAAKSKKTANPKKKATGAGGSRGGGGRAAQQQMVVANYIFRCQNASCNLSNSVLMLPSRVASTARTLQSKNNDFRCPICDTGVVNVKNNETRTEHAVCPFCFTHPPDFADNGPVVNQMRCFQCRHTSCPLAGGRPQKTIKTCPKCRKGSLVVKSKDNSFRISCDAFPKCKEVIWLPRAVKNAEAMESNPCPTCGAAKLALRLHLGGALNFVPDAGVTMERGGQEGTLELCIFCEKERIGMTT